MRGHYESRRALEHSLRPGSWAHLRPLPGCFGWRRTRGQRRDLLQRYLVPGVRHRAQTNAQMDAIQRELEEFASACRSWFRSERRSTSASYHRAYSKGTALQEIQRILGVVPERSLPPEIISTIFPCCAARWPTIWRRRRMDFPRVRSQVTAEGGFLATGPVGKGSWGARAFDVRSR